MSERRGTWSSTLPAAVRWSAIALLVLALLLLGIFIDEVVLFFTLLWRQGLAAAGLGPAVATLQQNPGTTISTQFLPAAITYKVLYLGLCLLLLGLLLTPAQWRLTAKLYAGALGLFIGMVLLTKLLGNAAWAYRLSRDFLGFVASPLPVAALYVLFQTGFGPQSRQTPP